MEPIIIYLTKLPKLNRFSDSRKIQLLRSGVYTNPLPTLYTPIWSGGDLYPVDDYNWTLYMECVKNKSIFEWKIEP